MITIIVDKKKGFKMPPPRKGVTVVARSRVYGKETLFPEKGQAGK